MTPSHDVGLRILAPLDDAPQLQRALTYARALAVTTGGKLKLVRATDLDDQENADSLANIASDLQAAGIDVEWSVVNGVDGQTAIHEAEVAWQPDLITLATSKLSDVDRMAQ